ncbi:MAG: M3 family oligoendopeptidase [Clostridiaceae bacterium]|nr:M3 family oligoendopeptidase [Clostridiaceae bacterium]
MKFSEMSYRRITVEEVKKACEDFMMSFAGAADAENAEIVLRELFAFSLEADTNMSLAFTRHSIDTRDAFYSEEISYYDENGPVMQMYLQKANDAVLGSPYRADLEHSIGTLFFRKLENEKKQFSEEIIPDLQEENRLTTEYGKLLGGAELTFDGKTLNLSQMMPYRTSSDRNVRRDANAAYYGWFAAHRETLDRIYDALVRTRDTMAKKLSFDTYVPLGYIRMERMDYNADMVKVYRDEVKKYLVPLVCEINERQRKRLGLDSLKYYDIDYQFATGNPHPIGTPAELVEKARAMYARLSPETKEFFDYMTENELMDLVAKSGKETGGYCTAFPVFKAPFIFSNFNGTKDDVDVLTHEAGHALQMYQSMRKIDIPAYFSPTYESCEIHSMSMELITSPYMEPFFGAETEKFRYMQLVDILRFIPYGCLVDEFQHEVYANPELTPSDLFALWRRLEREYMPDLDFDDGITSPEDNYLEQGGRWQRQTHIYERPFYYIDYTLAQVCAMQFYIRFDKHDPDAWQDYLKLCSLGGSKTFLGLVEAGGLQSPFKPGVMREAVRYFQEKLLTFDDSRF